MQLRADQVLVYPRSNCGRQAAALLIDLQPDLRGRKEGPMLGDGYAVLAMHDPGAAMMLADAETAQDP